MACRGVWKAGSGKERTRQLGMQTAGNGPCWPEPFGDGTLAGVRVRSNVGRVQLILRASCMQSHLQTQQLRVCCVLRPAEF